MNHKILKANANGNTFIIIENNNYNVNPLDIINICNKYKTDGLINVDYHNTNNIIMDYYNNDGSWETLCLNGLTCIGILLREAWLEKKKLSTSISSEDVDKLYRDLQSDGMIGGKLMGAGKSGFIFGILKESKDKELIKKKYINNIDFAIDEEGSKIINR